MKAYVELKRGLPVNTDIQKAIDGFESLVYDIKTFAKEDIVLGKFDYAALNNVFVGSIDTMNMLFNRLGKLPEPIDYPEFLFNDNLLTRKVSKDILGTVYSNCANEFRTHKEVFYFVKPVDTKLFDGSIVTNVESLSYFRGHSVMTPVWISDKIDIVSEWRAYIHNKKLVQCSNYAGDFTLVPDYSYIQKLIKGYDNAPVSYTIDVAVLKDGRTDVVEFNDFWAIGSYGLDSMKYAEMLRDRYFQIIGG